MFLQTPRQFVHRRRHGQHLADAFLGMRIELAAHQPRQIAVERADRGRDRHVVVVQDHDQRQVLFDTGVVHRLEGHAGSHRAVADNGNGVTLLALDHRAPRHASSGRDRRARMRRAEGVVGALFTTRKAADAAELTQAGHRLAAPGQDLVRVALMADIPDQAVFRRVEHVMQRDRQLHGAQVGRQMAAGLRHRFKNISAQLVSERRQLLARQTAQVPRIVDGRKQRKRGQTVKPQRRADGRIVRHGL